jgi:putative ABC transport system substrate-binding protein
MAEKDGPSRYLRERGNDCLAGNAMRRRAFIAGLGSAAAWPMAAPAQQPNVPVVGFLGSGSPEPYADQLAAFNRGLKETGNVVGQNVGIEYRWADNQEDRLLAQARDLVDRRVAVIAVQGATVAVQAAKAATTTIPIIFNFGADPVELGLVSSLNRPSGNLTGLYLLSLPLEIKHLELLHELLPNVTAVAALIYPASPHRDALVSELQKAARALGLQIYFLTPSTGSEIDSTFATLINERPGALLVMAAPFFFSRREQLAALATRYSTPTIYGMREYAAAGGLMSYGASFTDMYHQFGIYTGRILKGTKPADLPVMQPTKFELVINLKTANALGLTIPPSLLARADEVIE